MRTKYFKVYGRCTGNNSERIEKTVSIQLETLETHEKILSDDDGVKVNVDARS